MAIPLMAESCGSEVVPCDRSWTRSSAHEMAAIRAKAADVWKRSTLPHVDAGVRLMLRNNVAAFNRVEDDVVSAAIRDEVGLADDRENIDSRIQQVCPLEFRSPKTSDTIPITVDLPGQFRPVQML